MYGVSMPSVSAQRVRVFAFDRGGALGVAVLLLYLWIAPQHIVDGDNAEFVTTSVVGGVPHPSGYPLFVLWLRAMSWLPGVTPAHTAALATAILGAASIVVLQAAARAWGARPLAATISVAMFAAAPAVIRISTEAEVFALNNLAVATVLWLAARGGPLRGAWRVLFLALAAGLGLSDHVTCALVAPVGILGVVRGIREAKLPRVASISIAVGGLVLGLLPYTYLLVTSETPISWRRIDGLGELVHHFLRLDYGGFGHFAPGRDPIAAIDSLAALLGMLGRTWLWAPLLVGLGMLGLRVARPAAPRGSPTDPPTEAGPELPVEPRWGWAMLATSFVLAGPLLVARFNVPPVGIGLVICHRFHLLAALLLALPIAHGVDLIGARIIAALPAGRRSPVLGAGLAIAMFAALGARSLPHHSPAVERGVSNLLRSLPEHAVVIVSEDDLYFGSAYRQLVIGERPDVTVISFGQLLNPAYRDRLAARSGIATLVPGDKRPSLSIAADVLAHGRPMFVDGLQINILKELPTYPYGLVFRVLPAGTPRPPIEEVFTINQAIFAAFDLDYRVPGREDDYAAHVHERYARNWRIIASALAAANRAPQAELAMELAQRLSP